MTRDFDPDVRIFIDRPDGFDPDDAVDPDAVYDALIDAQLGV